MKIDPETRLFTHLVVAERDELVAWASDFLLKPQSPFFERPKWVNDWLETCGYAGPLEYVAITTVLPAMALLSAVRWSSKNEFDNSRRPLSPNEAADYVACLFGQSRGAPIIRSIREVCTTPFGVFADSIDVAAFLEYQLVTLDEYTKLSAYPTAQAYRVLAKHLEINPNFTLSATQRARWGNFIAALDKPILDATDDEILTARDKANLINLSRELVDHILNVARIPFSDPRDEFLEDRMGKFALTCLVSKVPPHELDTIVACLKHYYDSGKTRWPWSP